MFRAMLIVFTMLPLSAQGQGVNCGSRSLIVARLGTQYQERQLGAGLRDTNTILELWVSDNSGTWSALLSYADGTTCVMATGSYWRMPETTPPGVPG